MRLSLRGEHGCLGQQHQVSSRQVDVLVGGVVGGWHTANRPVGGWVDVTHGEGDARERQHPAAKRRRREQAIDHGEFAGLPRQADTDVDRLYGGMLCFVRDQHRAIEPA